MSRTSGPSAHRPAAGLATPRSLVAVLRFMRLIWAIDHELERVSKRMEARLGLTIAQRMSLLFVGENPGILASELAAVLHLHRATLSGIVRRLTASGYIEGTVSSRDARRVGLRLTRRGRAMNRRREGTFEAAVRQLLDSTPGRDLAAAERVLERLGAELRAAAGAPGAVALHAILN